MTPEEQTPLDQARERDTLIEKVRWFSRSQGRAIELRRARKIHGWVDAVTLVVAIVLIGPVQAYVGQMTGAMLTGAGFALLVVWLVLGVVSWSYQARINDILREAHQDENGPRSE